MRNTTSLQQVLQVSSDETKGLAASRYELLSKDREPVLDRAREQAQYTMPFILPPEGHEETNALNTPKNGLGAEAVNNLANKLLLTQLPPNQPFFSLNLTAEAIAELRTTNGETEINTALINAENKIIESIEKANIRKSANFMFASLIVTGNALIHIDPTSVNSGMKVFKLDRYVVRRDYEGNVLEIILKETLNPQVLPMDVYEAVKDRLSIDETSNKLKDVNLYTRVFINEKGKWESVKELCGFEFGRIKYSNEDLMPYRALRFTAISGENYGRGLVEQYFGDFVSLENLTNMLLEGAAASAKVLFLVKQGLTRISELAKAKNGAFVSGDPESVFPLQVNKGQDFSIAFQQVEMISQRIGRAFLLTSSIQRNAERVTAEEIREMASELESSLGGVYTTFAAEFQLPLVKMTLAKIAGEIGLSELNNSLIPVVTSGIDALGRTKEFNDLSNFIQAATALFGPTALEYINMNEGIRRLANASNIRQNNLLKSEEEVQTARQQAAATQMLADSAPGVASAVVKNQGQPVNQ